MQGIESFLDLKVEAHFKLLLSQSKFSQKLQFEISVKMVEVSHSLIAIGAVEVRVPLYLGHS